MDLHHDSRTVLTLDAGGTSFVFNALRGGRPLLPPLVRPSQGHDVDACLKGLVAGFQEVWDACGGAAALSFAFPGPTDYAAGVAWDLVNLPGFRGGVPLGPMLEDRFQVPVLMGNDGNLFTLGEALGGLLPEVNAALAAAGSSKRYRNLLGVTLGTGFGGGFVADGRLLVGDNTAAMEVRALRQRRDADLDSEEGASIRGVRAAYAMASGLPLSEVPEPRELFEIGMGLRPGPCDAARSAFEQLGRVTGNALAEALTLLDALVVVGGGLSGAAPLFLPSLVAEMNDPFLNAGGPRRPRTEVRAFNLEDDADRGRFLAGDRREISVPGSGRRLQVDALPRTGVGVTRLGTSEATALGAYAQALAHLDR